MIKWPCKRNIRWLPLGIWVPEFFVCGFKGFWRCCLLFLARISQTDEFKIEVSGFGLYGSRSSSTMCAVYLSVCNCMHVCLFVWIELKLNWIDLNWVASLTYLKHKTNKSVYEFIQREFAIFFFFWQWKIHISAAATVSASASVPA